MDPLTILLVTVAAGALIALAWMSGYELGQVSAQPPKRPTVAELINELPTRRAKSAKNRRKAQRRASK